MKKELRIIVSTGVLFLLTSIFHACSDTDVPPNKFIGTWAVQGLTTNNQTLDALLTRLIPAFPVPPEAFNLHFEADKRLTIHYLTPDSIRSIQAAYAFDEHTLALRFDAIPIPFNAFGITESTVSRLILSTTLPRQAVETLITFIIEHEPQYEQVLKAVLAEIREDGLKIDFEFIKTDVTPAAY